MEEPPLKYGIKYVLEQQTLHQEAREKIVARFEQERDRDACIPLLRRMSYQFGKNLHPCFIE